jgi:hypothetical protein
MNDPVSEPSNQPLPPALQGELPGIPRASSLHEILSGYGLTPSEAPGGMRRFRHELECNHLRATAEFWLTSDGEVESFRIWSQRPRKQRTGTGAGAAQPVA